MKQLFTLCLLLWTGATKAQAPVKLKEPALLYGHIDTTCFAIAQRPVTNREYLIYLEWLHNVYGLHHPEVFYKAIPTFQFPGTNSGEVELAFRHKKPYERVFMCTSPYVEHYMFNPKYLDYPVLGVSWKNANEFCQWYADRYNELTLIKKDYLGFAPNPYENCFFTTTLYLLGYWQGQLKRNIKTHNKQHPERGLEWSDHLFISAFRLPTSYELNNTAPGAAVNQELKPYPFSKNNLLFYWSNLYLHTISDSSLEIGLKEILNCEKITALKNDFNLNIAKQELVLDINNSNNSTNLFEVYRQNNQHPLDIDSLKRMIETSYNNEVFYTNTYVMKHLSLIMLDNGHNTNMVLVDAYKTPALPPVKQGTYSMFRIACSMHKETLPVKK